LKNGFLDYHDPKDKDTYLKEQMGARKQRVYEDVVRYIAHKHLLCVEMNLLIPVEKILSYIVEGITLKLKLIQCIKKILT
jgi:hypothetical protein